MDFGRLPPEINSGRMYAGPGALSMLLASVAWNRLAAEFYNAAAGYRWVTSRLVGGAWAGPSAASMAAAAAPYATWLTATAAKAEQAASQATAAAAAFEIAHTMTVPPSVITANRARLRSLATTNSLGQSSAVIAEIEAAYDEMWAQDAAAMYDYASASAAAAKVTSYTSPPHTVDSAGLARQGVAAARATGGPAESHAQEIMLAGPRLIGTVPQVLQRLASPSWCAPSTSGLSPLSHVTAVTVPASFAMYGLHPMDSLLSAMGFARTGGVTGNAAAAPVRTVASDADGSSGTAGVDAGPAVSAILGGAPRVGRLAIPGAWSAAASVQRTSTTGIGLPVVLWRTSRTNGPAGVRVTPIVSSAGHRPAPRFKVRHTVIPRTPAAG